MRILWDLDHTLYNTTDKVHNGFKKATVLLAQELGIKESYESLMQKSWKSWDEHLCSRKFLEIEQGICMIETHDRYHELIPTQDIEIYKGLHDAFDSIAGLSIDHAILTHGNSIWGNRVIDHLNLNAYFPKSRILSSDMFEGHPKKSEGIKVYELALQKINWNKADYLVEDRPENLAAAKKLGMITVLVNNSEAKDHPDADLYFNTAVDFLKYIKTIT